MFKRTVCIFALMLMLLSYGASANIFETELVAEDTPILYNGVFRQEGTMTEVEPENSVSLFSRIPFEEYICDYICDYILLNKELPEKITGLDIYNMEKDEFLNNYYNVMLRHPELLTMTGYRHIDYTTVDGKNIVTNIYPIYLVSSVEDAETARRQIAEGIEEYVALANQYETDLEKLIVIHDKMVADCVYDSRVLNSATESQVKHTVYHALGVFRDRFAVCQGYSQALWMIAEKIGIEMDFCMSDMINHMWNYVKLDGKWYHMDMTNDDPLVEDESGNLVARTDKRAIHRYFMISDSGLNPEAHGTDWKIYGTNQRYDCTDRTYESNHLFNMLVPFTAYKSEDGYYHVPVLIGVSEEGIEAEVDFKSASLYTGEAIMGSCVTERTFTENTDGTDVQKTENNFYVMAYATVNIENANMIAQYDNVGAIMKCIKGIKLKKDTITYTRIIREVPKDISLSFSSFLLNGDTLAPYAPKSVWQQ